MENQTCNTCKNIKEHVASLLPFEVIESAADKSLRIGGIATAKTVQEAQKLVEAGFDYVCEFNEIKVFKKRK